MKGLPVRGTEEQTWGMRRGADVGVVVAVEVGKARVDGRGLGSGVEKEAWG